MTDKRKLQDLVSVGPAIARDLNRLGIERVEQLVGRNPRTLFDKLVRITGQRQDPCVEDTFRAAVAQAEDPNLPREKCDWFYWSRVRKKSAP